MIINGAGGTGKSTLINAITETFAYHGKPDSLAKCATSGVAATHIGGSTIHSWAGLGIQRYNTDDWLHKASEKVTTKRRRNIVGKTCLIIDEMSMLFDTLFADVAKVVAYTMSKANEGDQNLPFHGMHVVLLGDFRQFPPIANRKGALYSRELTTNANALLGRNIYRQFRTVVTLRQQLRVVDEGWLQILDRLSSGSCTDDDIIEVRKLILSNKECPPTDFTSSPWADAILITSRHSVREAWNAEMLKLHCQSKKVARYIVPAEDFLKNGAVIPDLVRLDIASLNEKKTKRLRERVEIAVGMKMMVLLNLSTEADIANGTTGTIEDIILDPRDENCTLNDDGSVLLKYPPALIIFKPENENESLHFTDHFAKHTRKLPKGAVPLTPSSVSFTVHGSDGQSYTIHRRQFPITASYAITDIKSQGQTMGPALVDLSSPPSGKLSGFNAYVALSRSKGRKTIRLLRDFDETMFQTPPSVDLDAEMKTLDELDKQTKALFKNTHLTNI
jgi:ATP-dependent exoDNAse (exonuclease V) alpha subunit